MKSIRLANTLLYLAFIGSMIGCDTNEDIKAPTSEDFVLISPEAPQINGWSTEIISDTRHCAKTEAYMKEKDGLDMNISTHSDTVTNRFEKITTRGTNMDDNTVFRIIAYACTGVANITTSNYKEYGDYRLLSNGTIETIRSLKLQVGTYTFICYSYGSNANMAAFGNTSTSITAANGQNFMTCTKENIAINNLGSIYTLNGIKFNHHCVCYGLKLSAQSGRMTNITACSGTLALPHSGGTYSFTKNSVTPNSTAGNLNITWSSPNGMEVLSNYVYIFPLNNQSITVNLNPTIGGKAFTNKKVTLSGLTLKANGTYYSTVSFTTDQGYIVGGAFWARANLYYVNGSFGFYNTTEQISTTRSQDFWRWNALYPGSDDTGAFPATWRTDLDPCRKVSPAGTWRLPTANEYTNLIGSGFIYTSLSNKKGVKFGNLIFFPCSGIFLGGSVTIVQSDTRGVYWTQDLGNAYGAMLDFSYGSYTTVNGSDGVNHFMPIRCVRTD